MLKNEIHERSEKQNVRRFTPQKRNESRSVPLQRFHGSLMQAVANSARNSLFSGSGKSLLLK